MDRNKWLIRITTIIFDIVIPVTLIIYCFNDNSILGFLGGMVIFPLGLATSMIIKKLILEKLDDDKFV